MPRALEDLIERIAEFPGIGPRQARRIVQFLLHKNKAYAKQLARSIETVHDEIRQCTRCFRYDETTQSLLCSLCANQNRDNTTLVVIEKDVDIDGVETMGAYRGLYFVLGSLLSLTPQRKKTVESRTDALLALITKEKTAEVVLAFATTPEGDFTAQELKRMIREKAPETTVSLLGRGLSLGAEIEYADQETLRSAFNGRH